MAWEFRLLVASGICWRVYRSVQVRCIFGQVCPCLMLTCCSCCRHGKYMKMRRYPRGSVAISSVGFCTVIRGAFCIVPVQASGIFGQVPLSPAPVIPSCVYHALALVRSSTCSCAPASHPLLNYLARDSSLTLSPLSLSTSLSSSPLPSVSPSQRTLTPEHARFNITSASSGRKHRGHSLPCLFFHPPTFPLGTAPCTA